MLLGWSRPGRGRTCVPIWLCVCVTHRYVMLHGAFLGCLTWDVWRVKINKIFTKTKGIIYLLMVKVKETTVATLRHWELTSNIFRGLWSHTSSRLSYMHAATLVFSLQAVSSMIIGCLQSSSTPVLISMISKSEPTTWKITSQGF